MLVDRADKIGRLAILRVHAKQVALGPDADLEVIAAMTPGFSGADLANIINEATLLAVHRNKEQVGHSELQEAVERVMEGLEKKNRVLNKMEKEHVALHEVGHALVALSVPAQTRYRRSRSFLAGLPRWAIPFTPDGGSFPDGQDGVGE